MLQDSDKGKPHQRLGAMVEKIGLEAFKAAVLGG